jgi:hypothetical protein
MIPKKPVPHLMRDGYRFPACAKLLAQVVVGLDASAGEARSEKIMRQKNIDQFRAMISRSPL